jgi:hypothetical protein
MLLEVAGGNFPPRLPFLDEKNILEAIEPLKHMWKYPRKEVIPEEQRTMK